jgi:hypothetical protein
MATTAASTLAVILARVVVPVWLLAGALLKLAEASPTHLPAAMIRWAGAIGLDLMFVLQFSVAAELSAVGVMWLLPRLARTVGLAMLGVFLPVLIGDVLMGASSCGCFGSVEVHPGITLVVDLAFFLGLWVFGRRAPSLSVTPSLPTVQVVLAGLWTVASFAIAFGLMSPPAVADEAGGSSLATALPSEGYYLPEYDSWIGRQWSELPLAAWIRGDDVDLSEGRQFLLFYRLDCEHCHELMEVFFSESLPLPTIAVAVPERGGFPTEGVQPFVCGECRTAELPTGVDWFFQTPALVRLDSGIVECAAEVTAADPVCLDW